MAFVTNMRYVYIYIKSAPPAIPRDTPVTGMDALDEEKKHALFFLLLTTGNCFK